MRKQEFIFSKCLAFTLAEVLITLGVIGVVAAMTMPVLVQRYQEKVTVAKLKKVYSVLSQAFTMASTDNGQPDMWGTNGNFILNEDGTVDEAQSYASLREKSKLLADIMLPYLKTMKVCYDQSGCWYDGKVYALNGVVWDNAERGDMAKIVLNDGTMLAFGGQLSYEGHKGSSRGWILVDINGSKKPNKYGIDIFEFGISNKGIIPYGTDVDGFDEKYGFENSCAEGYNSNGHGCTAWIIYNENMDYLHCNDLSWHGKRKCD